MPQRFSLELFSCLAALAIATTASAQQTTLVSVSGGGTVGNNDSNGAVISGNGRYVAFTSSADNLVIGGDTNGAPDVFVRDLLANTTARVSVASDGTEHVGRNGASVSFGSSVPRMGFGTSISGDGQFIAFISTAPFDAADTQQCVNGNLTESCADIYVRDQTLNQTTRVSVAGDGSQANNFSFDPQISASGRYVVFTSAASNLVAGDQNGMFDVFVRDRTALTTTRVSLSGTGTELSAQSWGGAISGDGQVAVFLSAGQVVTDQDANGCFSTPDPVDCARAYLLDRGTGQVTRVPIPSGLVSQGLSVHAVTVTPDGRFVAMLVFVPELAVGHTFVKSLLAIYDRQADRAEVAPDTHISLRTNAVTISDNGRFASIGGEPGGQLASNLYDRQLHKWLDASELPNPPASGAEPFGFASDGMRLLFADRQNRAPGDINVFDDVYIFNRDVDGDAMPDAWETQFGLDPANAADGALDSDGDGVANAQEYANGTHPKGAFKRYFAEGAANSFFSVRFGLFNPNDQATTVVLEFLGSNSQTRSTEIRLAAHSWTAVILNGSTFNQPDNDFSTVVESDRQVVAERTMWWDSSGYGSHAETSIDAPATTWYLAEGSTGGTFDLFYLIQNPGATAANVTVTYLLPAPQAPVIKQYVVPAKTRKTIHVDEEDPAVQFTDVSAKVTADQPVLVERAMYFSTPAQPFAAGHEGAAVVSPTNSWFFAEGATGSFFDLFLLLANAETTPADVEVQYLRPIGAPIVKTYTVAPQSRRTINVDFEDPQLIDTPVSMIVSSTGAPIIAERAMWWPSPNWYEAHLSAGVVAPGTEWALADGLVTNAPASAAETFILIANTANTPGLADVTLFFADGTSMTKNYPLPPDSRTNVRVLTDFPDVVNKGGFGALIKSNGVPIVVERAMYQDANGQTWAAGTDLVATKLQ